MEGDQKFLGVLKAKVLEAKYEAKQEFPEGGEGVQNKKTFHGGSMDIFWNCTIQIHSKELLEMLENRDKSTRPWMRTNTLVHRNLHEV